MSTPLAPAAENPAPEPDPYTGPSIGELAGQMGAMAQAIHQLNDTQQQQAQLLNRLTQQVGTLQGARTSNPAPAPAGQRTGTPAPALTPVPAPATTEEAQPEEDVLLSDDKLKNLIGKEYVIEEKKYQTAIKDQSKYRKGLLGELWGKTSRVRKIMLPLVAAYAGLNIWEGNSIAESIDGLSNIGDIIKDAGEYVAHGAKSLFNVPEKFIRQEYVGSTLEKRVISQEGGPVYGFLKSIFGKDNGLKLTTALGRLATTTLGHNVVAQGVTYMSMPVWGATIAPIIGAPLAVWGTAKAYKTAKNFYGRFFKVRSLKAQEKANFQMKQSQFEKAGDETKVEAVKLAIKQIPDRVESARSKMNDAQQNTRRLKGLQNALTRK